MKHALWVLLLCALIPLHGQGISAPWDMSAIMKALVTQAELLVPVLDEMKPADWEAKGAPAAYTAQQQAMRAELGYLLNAARGLERQPDRLTLALETLFRMQALEKTVDSLADAVRRYQNNTLGDRLMSVVIGNSTNRDQLRQYVSDLAAAHEQEFRIVDQEAQRCRAAAQAAPVPRTQTARPAVQTVKPGTIQVQGPAVNAPATAPVKPAGAAGAGPTPASVPAPAPVKPAAAVKPVPVK